MGVILVPRGHALRPAIESLIADVYAQSYCANISAFPDVLTAMIDGDRQPICAAGLRFSSDGFFSENYLDAPIQEILSDRVHRPLRRDKLFEVSLFSSRMPALAVSFVREIIAQGEVDGFEWAFFTVIERLKILLERMHLPMVHLASADPSRVPDPKLWGSYYDHQPQVYAVSRIGAASSLHSCQAALING